MKFCIISKVTSLSIFREKNKSFKYILKRRGPKRVVLNESVQYHVAASRLDTSKLVIRNATFLCQHVSKITIVDF